VLVPLQAAGEEYTTRGFLLQTLGIHGRWGRTGGLEVSITAHATTNLLAFWAEAAARGMDTASDATAADASSSVAALLLTADVLYALDVLGVLHFLRRRKPGWLPTRMT